LTDALRQDGQKQIRIFYSYAQEDRLLRERLEKHLSILKFMGYITSWDSYNILAGSEEAPERSQYLESADIILLLVSAHFLASDYFLGEEVQRVLAGKCPTK